MNKTIVALAAAWLAAAPLHAQEAAPTGAPFADAGAAAGPSAGTIAWNAALVSDYRYRGISQTRLRPALQGGADYTDAASGLYAGTWLSTIRWSKDAGGGGDVEWDLYAGKRGALGANATYDVGVLGYVYPGNGLKDLPGFADANTLELYAQVGAGPATVKYSVATTNLFGLRDSRYSGYLDLSANPDLGNGWTLNLHAGRQQVRHSANASYTDWKIGVAHAFDGADVLHGVTVSLALVGTNADRAAYASPANGKFTGRSALVAGIAKVF